MLQPSKASAQGGSPLHEYMARVHTFERITRSGTSVPLRPSSGCRNYHERAQHPERAALGIFKADGAFAEYCIVPIVNIHPVRNPSYPSLC